MNQDKLNNISNQDKELLSRYIDVFDILKAKVSKEKYIVYGAGNIGALFFKKNNAAVVYFADKDEKKIGTRYCGREVLPIDQMVRFQSEYEIIVAAGIEKIYDILSDLKKAGISKCYVYQEEW